jgi:molecular chaperone GrpE
MITDSSIKNPEEHGDSNEGEIPNVEPANKEKSELNELSARNSELETKLQDAEKKYLYLYSEFENFRRRNERERIDFLKFGHESFIKELLQTLDNFERALEHAKSLAPEKGTPLAIVNQGIEMIHFQLLEILKAQGATPLLVSNAKFDPAFHEAVSEEKSELAPGTILKELQKGYTLHGRLLRAAKVVVAQK